MSTASPIVGDVGPFAVVERNMAAIRKTQRSGDDRRVGSDPTDYLAVIPYFDRKYQQTFCWTGRVRAKSLKVARKRVEKFLRNKELVVSMFLGPYEPEEGGPGYVEQYLQQELLEVGAVEVIEAACFGKSAEEIP